MELELLEKPYAERDGVPLYLTIVRQPSLTNMPVLIEIHGGGWSGGQRQSQISVMAADRANEGYLYLNIDYRLAPFHPYPAATDDVQSALDWVVNNAACYGGDAGRIGLFGFSAGGHLAALLALTSQTKIECAVSWGGPMDYRDAGNPQTTSGHRSCLMAFLGECHHDRPDLYRAISPVCFLTEHSTPLLIIHGENDLAVHPLHAQSIRSEAKLTGAPVDVHILPEAGHTDPGSPDPQGEWIWSYIRNWMAAHLKPVGPIRPALAVV